MSESTVDDSHKEIPDKNNSRSDDSLTELRRLLLGSIQMQLSRIQERLDNPELRAKEISRVLPASILLRSAHDNQIAKALETSLDESIKISIKKDSKSFANVLFPVLGPLIRKSISSTLLSMMQTFNQILENSFSLKGIQWRIEALRTKKSFGEIVLLNSLIYRVEQLFLIHKKTGLMLQHILAKEVTIKDLDLVSSMLTAILDFIQDSFSIKKDDTLEALKIGEQTVWIEMGPYAVLAAVIRGYPPEDLKVTLKQTIESIHITHGSELESFDGDVSPFATTKGQLEDCLQMQIRPTKTKISPLLWIVLGLGVSLMLFYFFSAFQAHQKWTQYLERLNKTPGLAITSAKKSSGKYIIFGFRDPLAYDPLKLLNEMGLKADKAQFHLQPYHSLYPEIVFKRMKNILPPSDEITFELKGDILYASGSASHQWIAEARRIMKAFQGILQYNDAAILDRDQREMNIIKERIEKQLLFFRLHDNTFLPGQENMLQELSKDIKTLLSLAQILKMHAQIKILGHTDSSGLERNNLKLSYDRADHARSALVAKGIDICYFLIEGVGSKQPLRKEITEDTRRFNRSVTFNVIINETSV